jgi:hypothetical protein
MKNREREICTSGSVRDEDGQPPHLLGPKFSALGGRRCHAAGRPAHRGYSHSRRLAHYLNDPPHGSMLLMPNIGGGDVE